MGWLFYHRPRGGKMVDEFSKQFDYDNDKASGKVIACKTYARKGIAYLAYEIKRKEAGERDVIGVVVLIKFVRDHYNFGYKDMTEDMGPYFYACPQLILNLLTPTDNENALAWRKRCREYWNK